VARLESRRNVVTALDYAYILYIFHGRIKSVFFHILDPVATAASGRRPKYRDGNFVGIRHGTCTQQDDSNGNQGK